MNIQNFNQLPQKERLKIFLDLKQKFNEENLNYFFKQVNIPENRRDLEYLVPESELDYLLSSEFNHSEWEKFIKLFDYDNISSNKKEIVNSIICSAEALINSISDFNKYNNCFIIDIKLTGSALTDLILLDNSNIVHLDFALQYGYKPYLSKNGFAYDKRNEKRDYVFLINEIQKENDSLQKIGKPILDLSKISNEINLHILAKDFLFHSISQHFNQNFFIEVLTDISKQENPATNFAKTINLKNEKLKHSLGLHISPKFMSAYEKKTDFSILGLTVNILNKEIDLFEDKKNIKNKFFKSIIIPDYFHTDISKSKITFDTEAFTKKEIEHILDYDYPMVKSKYPNFELKLVSRFTHSKDYLNKLMIKEELKSGLSHNNNTDKNYKKAKI